METDRMRQTVRADAGFPIEAGPDDLDRREDEETARRWREPWPPWQPWSLSLAEQRAAGPDLLDPADRVTP